MWRPDDTEKSSRWPRKRRQTIYDIYIQCTGAIFQSRICDSRAVPPRTGPFVLPEMLRRASRRRAGKAPLAQFDRSEIIGALKPVFGHLLVERPARQTEFVHDLHDRPP